MKKLLLLIIGLLSLSAIAKEQSFSVNSPDGTLRAAISIKDGKIGYVVHKNDTQIFNQNELSMSFSNGITAGENIKSVKSKNNTIAININPTVRVKTANINTKASELELNMGAYSIVFRVYDDAVAYRFVTRFKEREIRVMDEKVLYTFAPADEILFPQEESFYSHQERKFVSTTVAAIKDKEFCSPPMLVSQKEAKRTVRMLITEVDLESYPGIFYQKVAQGSFRGIFPHYPLEVKKQGDRNLKVTKEADYLSLTVGSRNYPWRVAVVSEKDTKLLESNTLYTLAAPSRIENTQWIKGGKIAWDWWNASNLTGLPFESGVNTETYKAFIDFASKHKLEYIVLDEGWYDIQKTILDVVPQIDMQEITNYAKSKNVGVILWATSCALDEKMDQALAQFKKWGIKGIKVDFMQRADQVMVDWYYSTARKAAELEILVDYHGAYTPRGLNRTYPNMVTSEGVYGLEQNKWIDDLTPEHNVTLAFTRMALGPMDYTPGAMRNVRQEDFQAIFDRPMSLGTRCHQLGMYVVYESPLQMLSDTPSAYNKEPEAMALLGDVPAVWDESRALAAEVSNYVVMARRNGDQWYIGALNDWTARSVDISLDFLGEGSYKMAIWKDGVNANRNAEDFLMETISVDRSTKLTLNLASGGGFAARIVRQ